MAILYADKAGLALAFVRDRDGASITVPDTAVQKVALDELANPELVAAIGLDLYAYSIQGGQIVLKGKAVSVAADTQATVDATAADALTSAIVDDPKAPPVAWDETQQNTILRDILRRLDLAGF